MDSLWPWLVVAGVGALHGLNPASGWMLAAAWTLRSGQRRQALWALVPIGAGHVASVALVAAAVSLGLAMERRVLQGLAGVLLVAVVAMHCASRRGPACARTAHAGLALWSFIVATVQGTGLMLVPALVPLCLGDAAARETGAAGSLWLALAALAVHMGAMLGVTGLVASAAGAWSARLSSRMR